MKKIKEKTYIKRLVSFIIGFIIAWFFYGLFLAPGGEEEMTDAQMTIAAVLSLLTMIIYELIVEFNYLKRLELTTDSLLSNISVYKERERKLLSKAEEIITRFLLHESDIQKSVASLRSGNKAEPINNTEAKSLSELKVTVENYPDLKSDKHISKILNQLEESENTILNSKLLYNEYVTYYNSGIVSFPATLLSGLWKLKPLQFYIDNEIDEMEIY